MPTPNDDIDLLKHAAYMAGEIGRKYFRKDPEVWTKGNDSPVTEADLAIDKALQETLTQSRPNYGWMSEETEDNKARIAAQRTFIIDPIDGTRGFIAGKEDWTISLAIVEAGRPTHAVLYAPIIDRLFHATAGNGAFDNETPLRVSEKNFGIGSYTIPARIAESAQEHMAACLTRSPHYFSLAYRIALVASGQLQGGIARPGAQDWDVAAADLILHEAGGILCALKGETPLYNQEDTTQDWLISCPHGHHEQLIEITKNAITKSV